MLSLLLGLTTLAALWVTRREGLSPLTAGVWAWVVTLLVALLDPADLTDVSTQTVLTVGTGIIALSLPSFLNRRDVSPPLETHRGIALARLVVLSGFTAAAVIVGLTAFRGRIAAAAGANFGDLSLTQVRLAQTGDAQGGGLTGLLLAAAPLLGCLGAYGAVHYSRLWWVLSVFALYASLQTPARLTTLSLLVQVAVFYYYVRTTPGSSVPKWYQASRRRVIVIASGVAAGGVLFFNFLGQRLGKNQLAAVSFPNYAWPDWTLSPVLYYTGGLPALSKAQVSPGDDPLEQGTSVFTLVRAASEVSDRFVVPNSLGDPVYIPTPFNVFTGFGQIWFDFGFVGVAVLSALLGWVAVVAHRRARVGRLAAAWAAATIAGLLLTMPQAYRLFYLDTLFQLAVGVLAFTWIQRSRERPGDEPSPAVVTAPGKRLDATGYRSTVTPGRTSSVT